MTGEDERKRERWEDQDRERHFTNTQFQKKKPGTPQLTEVSQAVLDAVDVGSLSDQRLVDAHDVLLNLDLHLALLFVALPRQVERLQELAVVLCPDLDGNLLVGLISRASAKVDSCVIQILDCKLLFNIYVWRLVAEPLDLEKRSQPI